MFGVTVPAHDAANEGTPPPAPLNQPYNADAGDKLNQSIQWVRTANHLSPVQVIKSYSKDLFSAPPEFGECSKMTATLGVQGGGVLDAEADLCSMPKDSAGNYTNFLKLVAIDPALAKTERGTLEAVLASYVLNMKAVQQHEAQPVKQSTKIAAAPSANTGRQSDRYLVNPLHAAGQAIATAADQRRDQGRWIFPADGGGDARPGKFERHDSDGPDVAEYGCNQPSRGLF